ncbi:type VII secretion protein EccE [Mycobacterium paraseoulense]|uniref:Type VII secretion protein EccE n=1 Tax=Mycobacterium paraseoulense TaxID=590652 RepID=A0A1X0I2I1_9MYCO|nr:type VII secretion protein EccE [Mycobacterium paraseoulense]MCV7397693.1 type VII secretion protein EccE [Mycobacterium paraseoulense]ORB33138.1 type VII secretion protein EccE [Mycobacterium paraseoulense]BBZ73115.1 type VII secretion protein EccE [Mycobacterium paraseoulense]
MSLLRWIPTPGPGRITLALLAIVPAVMAYPWRSPRDYWLLGIAAAVVLVLFGCWRGLYVTTLLRRRLAILGRGERAAPESATATTALLRVGAPGADPGVLPLLARYLDRYGIRADKIRITSRDNAADASRRETWIGITISATDNLAALRARSERIPLRETAQVVARRLADHLRELGWDVTSVAPDDVPRLLTSNARERWSAVQRGASDYLAAYQIQVDGGLAETLEAIRAHPARETCAALEIAGDGTRLTVAAACAFLTDTPPERTAPPAGLTAQRGNQRPALQALDLLSTRRLDGHVDAPAGLLAELDWTAVVGAAPVPETART